MNWLRNLFRKHPQAVSVSGGVVVFLDTDFLTKEEIDLIKQRMTPVFVEYSGHNARHMLMDVRKAVLVLP